MGKDGASQQEGVRKDILYVAFRFVFGGSGRA